MVGRTLVNGTKGGRGRRDNGWREVKGISAAFKKLAGNSLTSLGFRGAQCLNEFLDRTCSCWHLAYLHLTYFLPDHFHKFLLGSVRWLRTGWTGNAGKYYEWEEKKKNPSCIYIVTEFHFYLRKLPPPVVETGLGSPTDPRLKNYHALFVLRAAFY